VSQGAWQLVGLVFAVIVALISAAGAVLAHRAPRRASPYESIASRVVTLEEQREEDRAQIEELQDEVSTLKRERSHLQTEVAGLQRRIAGVYEDRDDLVRYITVFYAWVAAGARPPAPAVPEHLADVVPKWIPGDGAQLPHRDD
jgi:hypothetical protein